MVQEIERIHAELQIQLFTDFSVLRQRQINISKPWPNKCVPPKVPENGLRRWIGKDTSVGAAVGGDPLSKGISGNRDRPQRNRCYRVARTGDGGGRNNNV